MKNLTHKALAGYLPLSSVMLVCSMDTKGNSVKIMVFMLLVVPQHKS
jgi:hypothetical protein